MHTITKIIAVVGAVAGLLAVSYVQRQQQRLEVDTVQVSRGTLIDSTLASGHLEYQRQIKLTSELMGRVVRVPVMEGQRVNAGDVLLELDATAYQLDLDKARAQHTQAQFQIQQQQARLHRLTQQKTRSQQLVAQQMLGQDALDALEAEWQHASLQLQQASAALQQANAAVAQSQQWLSKTKFVAPIAGVVISVDVEPGETVIPGTTNLPGSDLLTLADTSALFAELRVDEADIGQIRIGQPAAVYAAAAPNTAHAGEVISISSAARQQGPSQALTFAVRVKLSQPDALLYPGMSCRAELKNQVREQRLLVPISAVQQQHVWRVNDQRVEKVAVSTGISNDTHIEIISGLEQGDQIVQGPGRVFTLLSPQRNVVVKPEVSHAAR